MKGKIAGLAVAVVVTIVALGAGMEVANQAGIFWGLAVTAIVMLFGLMASVVLIFRSPGS
jgi:ATP/ADP translocase